MHRRSMLQRISMIAMLLVFAGSANAAWEEIYNVENAPVPAGLSASKVQQAIVAGGAQRGWVIEPVGNGHLLATLNIRTHTVRADIHFDTKAYSITYKDSQNLKFKKGKIHGAYNKWVRNLNGDIQRAFALAKL